MTSLSAKLWYLSAAVQLRIQPMRRESFTASGKQYPYLVHPYNVTWRNERSVEIPLAREFLQRHGHGRGLEVGNVLSHYLHDREWNVLDKYETAPHVQNIDVLEYVTSTPLDYIVSISTLEHVGWDERPRERDKALRALAHLRRQLAPTGAMFVSMPLGHHPEIDDAVQAGIGATREVVLVREPNGRWRESSRVEVRPYIGRRGVGAGSVWIGEFAAL